MSTPKRLNCVQLGLYDTLEYAYVLGEDALKGVDIGVPPHKPISVSPGAHWHYYGVDPSRPCIAYWHSQQIPRTTWINAFVGDEPGIFSVGEVETVYPMPFSPDVSTDNVFIGMVTLDMLFAGLGLEAVEILALSIHGAELAVISGCSWEVRPRFIDVEAGYPTDATTNPTRERLDAIISAAGYQLIDTGPPSQDVSEDRVSRERYGYNKSHMQYIRSY